jgi:hypothetical protein
MSFYSNADPSPTAGLDIRSADRIDDFFFRVGATDGFMTLLHDFRGAETRSGSGQRSNCDCSR